MRVDGQRDKRQQLDQRLQRDGQHHAVMMLSGIDRARAKQDGKHRQQHRAPQRAVDAADHDRPVLPAAEYAKGHGHRLKLQRDVGHHGGHRDHRDQCPQAVGFAEARADEVGDRGDIALPRNAHHPPQHVKAEHEQQDRSQVNRQIRQPAARSCTHRAVERP